MHFCRTRRPLFLLVGASLLLSLLSALSACTCDRKRASPAASSEKPPPSAPPPASASPLERRVLLERDSVDGAAMEKVHSDVVAKLDAARDLLGKNEARRALDDLKTLRAEDPLGGALNVTLARTALEAGEPALAERAARLAALASIGSKALADAELVRGQALDKLGRPADAAAAFTLALAADSKRSRAKTELERLRKSLPAGPIASAVPAEEAPIVGRTETCTRLENAARAGKGELGTETVAEIKSATCNVDFSLDVGAQTLAAAHAFKVDVDTAEGLERSIWVGLETAQGVKLFGPVVRVVGFGVPGAVNDAVVDLQKIDILPGGSPEVVVKVVERRTFPDAALGEAAELDETRAMLLTVDRGPVQASREFVLSSDARRERIGEKMRDLPRGFTTSPPYRSNYDVKVGWGSSNEIMLTKVGGNGKPRVEGSITLFE